jgi:hypothetical protein
MAEREAKEKIIGAAALGAAAAAAAAAAGSAPGGVGGAGGAGLVLGCPIGAADRAHILEQVQAEIAVATRHTRPVKLRPHLAQRTRTSRYRSPSSPLLLAPPSSVRMGRSGGDDDDGSGGGGGGGGGGGSIMHLLPMRLLGGDAQPPGYRSYLDTSMQKAVVVNRPPVPLTQVVPVET